MSTAAYAQVPARVAAAGLDGVRASTAWPSVIDQLAGVPIPASAIEPLVFGQRVRDYQPAMLDELLASGEVTWSGAGQIGSGDGWIAFHSADSAPLTLAAPTEIEFTDAHRNILDTLGHGGAYFFRQLDRRRRRRCRAGQNALWELIWAGWVTGDTFAPVRALLPDGAAAAARTASVNARRG